MAALRTAVHSPIRFLAADRTAQAESMPDSARALPTTIMEARRLLEQFQYKRNDREPPTDPKRRNFRQGWRDATVRHEVYADKGLIRRLCWQNLGYRLGDELRERTDEEIDNTYSLFAELYRRERALPGEIVESRPLIEGAVYQVCVNAYERNPIARDRCIEHYGDSCSVCGLSFKAVYSGVADGFIHVHHLRPPSEIRRKDVVDPLKDLRPVCPNCHAVLHTRTPPLSIEELRPLVRPEYAAVVLRLSAGC